MSYPKRDYSKLWGSTTLSSSSQSKNIQKLITSIDESTDLSTSTQEYAGQIAQGMVKMLSKGLRRSDLVENDKFFEKLMDLGKSIMNGSKSCEDMFTLGMVIETKISKSFLIVKFYKLILRTLGFIKDEVKVFTGEFIAKLKDKIKNESFMSKLDYFYQYREVS
jgi:hypothetical protein